MATNNEKVGILIKEFSNPVAVQTIYIKMLDGNVAAALFLSQLIYWSDRTKDKDGWVYKTYAEWYKEIGLSQYKISKAAEILEGVKIIKTWRRRRGENHQGPVAMHYKLTLENLTNSIMKFLDNGKTLQSEYKETRQSDNEETSSLSTIDYSKDYNNIAPQTGAGVQPPKPEPKQAQEKPRKQPSEKALDLGAGGLDFLPPGLRPFGDAFIQEAGDVYMPTKKERSLWLLTLNEWAAKKYTPELIKLAIREMRAARPKPLTIGGPQSITKIAKNLIGNIVKDEVKIWHAGDDPER